MAAWTEFTWNFIAPGENVSLFIHGYSDREAVAYSAAVSPLSGDAYFPLGHINMTEGEVYRHVDGTVARKIYVQNLAPFNPCAVSLNIISETF